MYREEGERPCRRSPGKAPQLRRRDKSTAIDRGACGWLDWLFLSAPAHTLLAHPCEKSFMPTVPAPSPLPNSVGDPPCCTGSATLPLTAISGAAVRGEFGSRDTLGIPITLKSR